MADIRLALLKSDLQMMTEKLDTYLGTLLSAASQMIVREGVALTDSEEDQMLQVMYAAYLYRRRHAPESGNEPGMPRMLRYALNNRLLSEKAGGPADMRGS